MYDRDRHNIQSVWWQVRIAGWLVCGFVLKLLSPGPGMTVQSSLRLWRQAGSLWPGPTTLETGLSLLLTSYPLLALVPVSRGLSAWRVVKQFDHAS